MHIAAPPLPSPDPEPDFTATAIFALMLDQLDDALPPLATDAPTVTARRRDVARAMVLAAHPTGPIEAAMAISTALAYQASLTSTALAAAPGLTAIQSNRHARTAIAQHRAFQTGIAALAKHRAPAQPATTTGRTRHASRQQPEPEARDDSPIPSLPQFKPRDRHGNPIPLHRWQDMTRKQKLATYGDPYDTAAWAAATEEEDAAIAEQQALDAAAGTTT